MKRLDSSFGGSCISRTFHVSNHTFWRFTVSRLQSLVSANWSGFDKAVVNPIVKDHFSFQFPSQEEIDRVWCRGPWIFDGVLMGLRQVRKDQAFTNVSQVGQVFYFGPIA